jgi:hypothetical protein
MSLIALVLAGCPSGDDAPPLDPEPVTIASITDWTRVTDTDTDVFADMRPPSVRCDESGFGLEQFGLSFEIKTGLCDYLTVAQPTLEPLVEGDVIAIRIWHDQLRAATPGEGYVGLALGGELLWEDTVPIPSEYGTVNADVTIDRDVPAGTELQYHVHNHGINSWNLLEIRTIVEVTP